MEEGADRTVRARGQGGPLWSSLFQSWHSSSLQQWWPAQNQDNQHSRMGEGGASNSHSKLKSYRELMAAGERVWSLSGWPLQWMALPPCIPALVRVRGLFFKKEYMKLGEIVYGRIWRGKGVMEIKDINIWYSQRIIKMLIYGDEKFKYN